MYWLCQYTMLQVWVVQDVTAKDIAQAFIVGEWVTVSIKPVKWIPA